MICTAEALRKLGMLLRYVRGSFEKGGYWADIVLYSLFIFYFVSCSNPVQNRTEPGILDTVYITIDESDLRSIYKNSYLKHWYFAKVWWNDSDWVVRMQMHGNTSREYPKKSYDLDMYDPAANVISSSWILSSQYSDITFSRYCLANHFFVHAGFLLPEIIRVHVVINGRYEGMYLAIEAIDEHFFRRRNLPSSSLYKVRIHGQFTTEYGASVTTSFEKKLPDGDMSYNDLEKLIEIIDDGITSANRYRLESWIAIDEVINYYAISIIINNSDGIVNNFWLYFDPRIRKFRIIPWDLDMTFYHAYNSIPVFENGLFEQVIQIQSYREQIIQNASELYSYDDAVSVLDSLSSKVATICERDPYLKATRCSYEAEIERIYDYLLKTDSLVSR